MTRIGIVTEQPGETRVAATPQTAAKLRALGYDIVVETSAGHESSFPDASYEASGAAIVDRATAWGSADGRDRCQRRRCLHPPTRARRDRA